MGRGRAAPVRGDDQLRVGVEVVLEGVDEVGEVTCADVDLGIADSNDSAAPFAFQLRSCLGRVSGRKLFVGDAGDGRVACDRHSGGPFAEAGQPCRDVRLREVPEVKCTVGVKQRGNLGTRVVGRQRHGRATRRTVAQARARRATPGAARNTRDMFAAATKSMVGSVGPVAGGADPRRVSSAPPTSSSSRDASPRRRFRPTRQGRQPTRIAEIGPVRLGAAPVEVGEARPAELISEGPVEEGEMLPESLFVLGLVGDRLVLGNERGECGIEAREVDAQRNSQVFERAGGADRCDELLDGHWESSCEAGERASKSGDIGRGTSRVGGYVGGKPPDPVDKHRVCASDERLDPAVEPEPGCRYLSAGKPQRSSEVVVVGLGMVDTALFEVQHCGSDTFLEVGATDRNGDYFTQGDELCAGECVRSEGGEDSRIVGVGLGDEPVADGWQFRGLAQEAQAESGVRTDPQPAETARQVVEVSLFHGEPLPVVRGSGDENGEPANLVDKEFAGFGHTRRCDRNGSVVDDPHPIAEGGGKLDPRQSRFPSMSRTGSSSSSRSRRWRPSAG